MAECKECVHCEVCPVPHLKNTSVCKQFKDRTKYVEVVRCKDCRQWSRNAGVADSPNGHCFCHDIEINGYDFCSYGERRKEK